MVWLAVFMYEATAEASGEEESGEKGIVAAKSPTVAKEKLRQLGLEQITLTRLRGLRALVKRLTADAK